MVGDDPFLEAIEHKTDVGGYQARIPVQVATNTRVGAGFATAQSANSNNKAYAFLITYSQIYSVISWSIPTLQQSMSDKVAFESVMEQEMLAGIAGLNMKIATQIYRSGTGSVSQVNSSAVVSSSTFYLPLANQQDINLFELGDLVAASAADGGALRTGSVTVTGIDLNTGSLIASGTWSSGITSLAAGDYLYRTSADSSNGGTAVVLQGFTAWCPATTLALTTSFFGVLRRHLPVKTSWRLQRQFRRWQ